MPRKKKEEVVVIDQSAIEKYEVKERIYGTSVLQTIYQGKTLVAVMDSKLTDPKGVAEGICIVLNKQDKYILPTTPSYGGGYVRKLTKEEEKRQEQFIKDNWGIKD